MCPAVSATVTDRSRAKLMQPRLALQAAINMVKREVKALAGQVSQLGRVRCLRLAFIGYADYQDEVPIQLLDLTQSLQKFCKYVDKVALQHGFDDAEDVFSGLEVT